MRSTGVLSHTLIQDFEPGTIVKSIVIRPEEIWVVCNIKDNGYKKEVSKCFAVNLKDGSIWSNENLKTDFEVIKYPE